MKKDRGTSFNGEDVVLHWINQDQHYIKTIEYTKDSGKKDAKDYFIHKDLKQFLNQELRDYISHILFPLENVDNRDVDATKLDFKIIDIVKKIAFEVIELLDQFENFQLQLWKRKKFVLKTNYIITLDKIEEYTSKSFLNGILPEILSNKSQIQEWKELFKINDTKLDNTTNIESNKLKTLPIDTRYFDNNFKWNLLTALTRDFELNDMIDGILIKSDNVHALNLIMKRFKEWINLIYIDPPYNTGHDYLFFKNTFLDSSWLGLMYDRLVIAHELLNRKGNMFVRIDQNGNQYIRFLLDRVFGKANFRNEIIVNKTKAKQQIKKPFIQQTESLFYYSQSEEYYFDQVIMPRKNPQWYELLDLPRINETPRRVLGKLFYPPKNRRWGLSQERIDLFEQKEKIRINRDKRYVDCRGITVNEKPELFYDTEPVRNDWLDIPGYSQTHKFPTEDSEELLKRVIESGSKTGDLVLDYFSGSGTTIATAHKLDRKWMGIEKGSQFEEFIIPRMKNMLKGEKTGISKTIKAKRSGFFKYQYLEQFEDSIENFEFDAYVNKNLRVLEDFEDPFNFGFIWFKDDQAQVINVDIIETFNYLLGITLNQIKVSNENGKKYLFIGGTLDSNKILVVWRSLIDLDYDADKKIIQDYLKNKNYDTLYLNGKYMLDESISIEQEFRKLMWE
jgi:adenine-specific DNA-methyltransferase